MKNKAKKIMATILGLALTTSMWGSMLVSAAGTVNVSLSSNKETVVEGTDVVITAKIDSSAGVVDGILGYTVKMTYDSAKYTFVDADLTANVTGVFDF